MRYGSQECERKASSQGSQKRKKGGSQKSASRTGSQNLLKPTSQTLCDTSSQELTKDVAGSQQDLFADTSSPMPIMNAPVKMPTDEKGAKKRSNSDSSEDGAVIKRREDGDENSNLGSWSDADMPG
jgi:hypothetical protein